MSHAVNKVFLLGNLGKDPETKSTSSGKTVTKLTLATNERFKGSDGTWQDKTEWHNVVIWQSKVGDFLKKGSKVHIEGRLQTRSWEDKQTGQKKYMTEIVASDVTLCDPRPEATSASKEPGGNSFTDPPTPITDDDIPF